MRLTRLAIATAPALFVLLWSTGFIGARYGLPYIEPLTFLAVRMVFAVVILAGIALAWGARWCTDFASEACSPQSVKAYPPGSPRSFWDSNRS